MSMYMFIHTIPHTRDHRYIHTNIQTNFDSVDLHPALAAMDAHPDVRYVGLRTTKTRHVTRETVEKVNYV